MKRGTVSLFPQDDDEFNTSELAKVPLQPLLAEGSKSSTFPACTFLVAPEWEEAGSSSCPSRPSACGC